MKQYWILKTEPETYGWKDLSEKKAGDLWDGIRNYQARNYLAEMKEGDITLIYHSGKERSVVGIAKVVKAAFPDPADNHEKGWLAIRIKAKKPLNKPVSLKQIKDHEALQECAIVKQSRLSVIPLTDSAYDVIMHLSS